ncbi:MAG: ribonuclease activity regulator RraA [Gemmatimonadetes bacterium]|jgi:5-oxopent-3-ene-1,2,5-tricarboxylate decarboxylase / 2-hydroxyhepta-2,4-diene-1,7-dioate isomerase|nr:ribonuclease activity regulator RraA [Gemmatimonadota bacterium]MBT6144247.1 ribonuclease activity regulator RraA [Gemmatimonadota bacterium]MBT7861881.1 ribonuclease activity regulator RraA [Gemmatimonadota bacterium]
MQGPDYPRPAADTIQQLSRASTATLQTILKRLGVRRIWMPLHPLARGMKCVGPALTIRSVPGREDMAPIAYQPETAFPGHPDDAIDAIQPGDVVVLDGHGAMDEGLFGDLLTLRMQTRGAAGSVSDMGVRDSDRILDIGLPTFSRGHCSPGGTVYNVDFNVPIGCAGCLVCPGDVISADDDGTIVIPAAMLPEVTAEVMTHEDREDFIRLMLAAGEPLQGLYPMGESWEARFRTWRRDELGR